MSQRWQFEAEVDGRVSLSNAFDTRFRISIDIEQSFFDDRDVGFLSQVLDADVQHFSLIELD